MRSWPRRGGGDPQLAAPQSAAHAPSRIESIDLLRGLVMVLMALDHTRDFFGESGFNPRDVTDPALFLTRWITHFCAPTFILVAGLSAYLYSRGKPLAATSRFLLVRGLWLVLIQFTLVGFGWSFSFDLLNSADASIIWVIGVSMVALEGLVWLPRLAIGVVAFAMIAGHDLFDGIKAEDLGGAGPVWHVLHQPGLVRLGEHASVFILYPLIPWIGVMAAGYLLGPVMQLGGEGRRRWLLGFGAALTIGFLLLRATNLYGDPEPWTRQETPLTTLLSFLNCEKYPPSLLYLMMTLGPALMLLALFEDVRGRIAHWLAIFGRVPFFFYVVHVYLIHIFAVAAGLAMTDVLAPNPKLAVSLPGVYFVLLLALVLLYPMCRWFARLKERGTGWWWAYL
jgi:uncharacterized membrane protein